MKTYTTWESCGDQPDIPHYYKNYNQIKTNLRRYKKEIKTLSVYRQEKVCNEKHGREELELEENRWKKLI